MKRSVRVTLITGGVVMAIVLAAIIYAILAPGATPAPESTGDSPSVVRANSHILDDGGAEAPTVVEFLDFECEACGAFYPIVEDVREKYEGQITYVIRYLPLPGHFNSTNAALAAEAAAQQGKLEDMYHRLFETQAEWGEAQESRADIFRDFAEEIGLDMVVYDAAIEDPATLERVELDFNDARALGVSSTPTFFLDGKRLELQQWNDLEAAIEVAVNGGR